MTHRTQRSRRPVLKFLLYLALALSACSPSTPYDRSGHGPAADPVPAPTPDDPNAYNYLPSVLNFCSEAESPLYHALLTQPLEKTRPLLTSLGLIQDRKWGNVAGTPVDWSLESAINRPYRLFLRQDFSTTEGMRIAWIFIRGVAGGAVGPGGMRIPTVLALTTDTYTLLDTTSGLGGAHTPTPATPQPPNALLLEFARPGQQRFPHFLFTASHAQIIEANKQ